MNRTGGWATGASFDSRCSAEALTMISKGHEAWRKKNLGHHLAEDMTAW